MAYIPPHKRHSYEAAGSSDRHYRPSPIPQSLVPQFRRNLNLRLPPKPFSQRSGKIVYNYAEQAISTWFPVGLDHNHQFPSSVHVDSVPLPAFERTINPLVLFHNNNNQSVEQMRSPWVYIAENVVSNLLSAFQNVRNEKLDLEDVKPKLVARFGKILFHESPSINEETTRVGLATETTLSQLKRSFYTNIPNSYMENIKGEVAQKIKFDFEEEKDLYHVKLCDATLPNSNISCKCSVIKEDKRLQLYKIELQQVRHMVIDISCLDKNLDLRLMLSTKRILTTLADDEMQSIRSLINSAILDPDVKGGLRWPLGRTSSEGRYCVVGVSHTIAKDYKSSSLRLKVRHADRYNFRTSIAEATREITLKLKNIVSLLQFQEQEAEVSLVSEMLKDHLRLIWDHFLCCEHFFDMK
ncbi:uncharacterized protein LOC115983781 isoform X1 [Quercus lobata]|uniref:uncharacterized protein LOC115983781 isoform X1 n=1 Tax=Quercus lobata TaxID=97700 RepID=UPI0012490B3F|nr:uncharacterized protein LOC115983781 isoform X1 [Quercus lobata]